ncbi:MAG TPA: TerC family protein [Pirellulales bacterium]|nr:TerC family protein [Pirellulales bacterium]
MAEIPLWYWLSFAAFVVVMLALDLGVFHRKDRESTLREAGIWTAVWCVLALFFNGFVWWQFGGQAASEFLAGYLVEWSLSMDNVFVFAVIFSYFRVPMKYQHRVLFWGILGAVFLRLTFIVVGETLIDRFKFILPLLGLVLIYSGIKLAFHGGSDIDPEKNPILRAARRILPVSTGDYGTRFFVREAGRWCVTSLFLVLLVVESTDVVFAVDSVPAIFGLVDEDANYFTFVVFTSNVFAILGLRALYFLLAGMMGMFRYLSYGLSAILVFVGLKMIAEYAAPHLGWTGSGHHLVPPWASLLVVISLLGISIAASLMAARQPAEASEPQQ